MVFGVIYLVNVILVHVTSGRAADVTCCTNMRLSKFTGRVFFYKSRPDLTVMRRDLTAELWLVQIIHRCAFYINLKKVAVSSAERLGRTHDIMKSSLQLSQGALCWDISTIRGEFRPRQTRQLPRAVDLKGRLLSCQSY